MLSDLVAGAPAWNRLKSHNSPDRYVRHVDNVLPTDPTSATLDKQDAPFRIVV
jgi:hypothetical protein